MQIETQSEAPAILVLNDTNYPGWRVSVNGNPATLLQANYLFRGVMIPAGPATVEFSYEPDSFRIGASISAVSLVVVAILLFVGRIPRRKSAGDARRAELPS